MSGADAALRLLGLAARAGAVVPGTERAREAVRAGEAKLVLVAVDASDNSRDKILPLLRVRGVPHLVRFDRAALGAAVGRGPLSAVAVTGAPLAERLKTILGNDSEPEV